MENREAGGGWGGERPILVWWKRQQGSVGGWIEKLEIEGGETYRGGEDIRDSGVGRRGRDATGC